MWTGQLVSLIGTWMQSLGQAWLVLELTDSPFRLGLVATLQFTPMLFLSVFAGALADRLPKRRLLLVTQTVLLLQASGLAALTWSGHVRYWHVAVLALGFGLATTVDLPARQAFVAELVGRADLPNAIALNSAAFNAARIVGPAVAGLLIARYGTAAAFAVNAASFLAVIAALAAVHAEGNPRAAQQSVLGDISEGLQYALQTPRIALVLALLLAVSAFLLNHNLMVPLLARTVLGQGAHGLGFLMAALGAGALAAAVVVAVTRRRPPGVIALGIPALVVAVGTLLLSVVRDARAAAALLFVIGFASIVFMTGANTTLQLAAPDRLRGRMMSLYTLAFAGVAPFGAFFLGAVTEGFGVPAGFAIAGSLGLITVTVLLGWWAVRFRD